MERLAPYTGLYCTHAEVCQERSAGEVRSIENPLRTKAWCANRRLGGQPAEGGKNNTEYLQPIAVGFINYPKIISVLVGCN